MSTIEIRIVTDPAQLREVHRDVIMPCFVPEERGTEEGFVAGVTAGTFKVLAAHDGDVWAGCAVTESHPEVPDVVLLAWLAVTPAGRAGGLGSQLLARALTSVGDRLVLGEMEPADAAGSAATGDPARRVRYYAQHGGKRIAVPYFQPPMSPGNPRLPMTLFALPSHGATLPDAWPSAPIAAFLDRYLDRRPGPDPQRDAVFEALRGPLVDLMPLT